MKKTTICILLIAVPVFLPAQPIESRINIYGGYSVGMFHGQPVIDNQGFLYPSLFSNYTSQMGWNLKGLVRVTGFCRIGAGYEQLTAQDCECQDYVDYQESEMDLQIFSLNGQFYTRLGKTGPLNLLTAYAEISADVGASDLRLMFPVVDIKGQTKPDASPLESTDHFYGAEMTGGLEFMAGHSLGFYLAYSFGLQWTRSALYVDERIEYSQVNAGVFLRLFKEKRYFY
jgi:hypothetical protein